ncbi:MAG: TRAP transporter large permease [Clostridiales bacterium]|nr:TRAP transporter large permease [Clostridiales bacterium]
MAVYLFLFLFLFMALGMPIAFAMSMGLVATIACWGDISFSMIFQQMFQGVNSFSFIAVPMFIMAGDMMGEVGIIDDILTLCRVILGKIPGSLANANIIASMFFAGVSGSAVADTAAIGGALIPAMIKEGYDADFSVAVTASSSVIGPIIPPSVGMVLYGAMMGVSISALFMGGITVGIVLGLSLMVPATYYSIKRNYPRNMKKYSLKEIARALIHATPALLMPIIILGGIMFGVCSPTEAASIAILYAIIIGLFYYHSLSIKMLWECMERSMISAGAVLFISAVACPTGWLVALGQVPVILASAISTITNSKNIVLLLINIFILILGCGIDANVSLLIFGPILAPLAQSFGVNPIHFGIIFVLNITIGLATPPYGACIFIASSIAKQPLSKVMKSMIPFCLCEIAVLMLATYCESFVLFIPRLLGMCT